MPHRNWRLRIEDILESIDKIQRYTAGMDFTAFSTNEMVIDAVIRNFAVIGEAACHVPENVQIRYAVLPWGDMRDMRNVLIHQYFGADLRTVWDTVQSDLPPLIPIFKQILDENPD